ncbi:unnamed protein product [Urochloa humidicola]
MAAYKNSEHYGSSGAPTGTAAHHRIDDETASLSCDAPAPTTKNVFDMTDAAVELEPPAAYCNSGVVAGEAFPLVSKVLFDKKTIFSAVAVAGQEDKVTGAFTERLRRGLPILGISAASLAVTGLAAGEPTPAAGFGMFLMLIVGLSAVTIRALRD